MGPRPITKLRRAIPEQDPAQGRPGQASTTQVSPEQDRPRRVIPEQDRLAQDIVVKALALLAGTTDRALRRTDQPNIQVSRGRLCRLADAVDSAYPGALDTLRNGEIFRERHR